MSNFIIALFSLSMLSYGFCSMIHNEYYYSMQGFLFISLPLFILIFPLSKFERRLCSTSKFYYVDHRKNLIVMSFVVLIGLYSLLFFMNNLGSVFSSDLTTLRYVIQEEGAFYESSIYSKVAVFGAYLSPLALFLFFYSCVTGFSRKYSFLLLLSSLSFILYTLNVAGRDGIVIWLLNYGALFCFFYRISSNKLIRNQVVLLFSISMFVVPVFLYISFQRFSSCGGFDHKVLFSGVDYLGQQLYELSSRLDILSTVDYRGEPRNIIPSFYSLWEIVCGEVGSVVTRYDLRLDSMSVGLKTYRFTFFVGDIVTELGMLGVFLYTLIASSVFYSNLKIVNNCISLSRMILVFLWYMPIIVGVFYFYYGQLVGNVFLLFAFMVYLFYRIKLPILIRFNLVCKHPQKY